MSSSENFFDTEQRHQQLYEEGRRLFLAGKYEEATQKFMRIYEDSSIYRDVAEIVEDFYAMEGGKDWIAKYKQRFSATAALIEPAVKPADYSVFAGGMHPTDKFIGLVLAGFIGILLAFVVGSWIGDAIPHERAGRIDDFRRDIISATIFLAGIGIGYLLRFKLMALWVSLALAQVAAMLSDYVGFFGPADGWVRFGTLRITYPFLLSLLALHGLALIRRRR